MTTREEIDQVGSNMPTTNTPKLANDLFDILKAMVAHSDESTPLSFSWADTKMEIDMASSSDAEQTEEAVLQAAMLGAAELDVDDEFDKA